MPLNETVGEVTARIEDKSRDARASFLEGVAEKRRLGSGRGRLSCGNLAHAMAANAEDEKAKLAQPSWPNLAVVTAYNDMLSAHQPFATFPELIKQAAREAGAVAQVAGGTPAMCDGVTQGRPGMELSLFSRDVIALATGVALTHDAFDAAILLGVCDKIVPGQLIGAMSFAHLPAIWAPAGPMPSGLPNRAKAAVRERFAQGLATRTELLEAEAKSYHAAGTCTFYGTANSNQMLMELMGLQLPGTSFINPGTPMRAAMTRAAVKRAVELARPSETPLGLAEVFDAKALVNGVVGLLATGGSTNHTIHLVAIARAAGLTLTWDDICELSAVVPLLARVYPNGAADVNQFHAAGGLAYVTRELLAAGLVHPDTRTIMGEGLAAYAREPVLADGAISWREGPRESLDRSIIRPAADPFDGHGGLVALTGNLGAAIVKTSAVAPEHQVVEAPAAVFDDQDQFMVAYAQGKLDRDHVAVVRRQGPRANGMPELHKLSPSLGALQGKGRKVALVSDGRMSGASGKVLAAIHVCPEAEAGGAIAKIRDGDIVRVDARAGVLEVKVSPEELASRAPAPSTAPPPAYGWGREMFARFRSVVSDAQSGASVLF